MYEILQHTADVRIRILASSLEQLFREAVDALMDAMGPGPAGGASSDEVDLQAADVTALLVDFLGEILLRSHLRQQAYAVIQIAVSETSVQATLAARSVEAFAEDVKAVTYHEADVRRAADGTWSTNLVLDV